MSNFLSCLRKTLSKTLCHMAHLIFFIPHPKIKVCWGVRARAPSPTAHFDQNASANRRRVLRRRVCTRHSTAWFMVEEVSVARRTFVRTCVDVLIEENSRTEIWSGYATDRGLFWFVDCNLHQSWFVLVCITRNFFWFWVLFMSVQPVLVVF